MLRWNSDQRYLLELPPLGIAIIPTQIAHARELRAVLAPMSGSAVIVKIDWAIRAHGVAGVTSDFPLARLWAGRRDLLQLCSGLLHQNCRRLLARE